MKTKEEIQQLVTHRIWQEIGKQAVTLAQQQVEIELLNEQLAEKDAAEQKAPEPKK